MRTLDEIILNMKADFVGNTTIRDFYKLEANKTFDEQFSKVSFEGILIFLFAFALWGCEKTINATKEAINVIVNNNYVCGFAWYYNKCLTYQDGHDLIYNPDNYSFGYANEDEAARIIKFAAVRQVQEDNVTKLRIYVSDKDKKALDGETLARFTSYIKKIGAAGDHFSIISKNPDRLKITAQINYNPLLLDNTGKLINGGNLPVNEAIEGYINNLDYGGKFNKTKLVDAIQEAAGVDDVILMGVEYAPNTGNFETLTGQNIESSAGCFIIESLDLRYLAV